MKKDDKKDDYLPKKSKKRNKKTCSIDVDSHNKFNNFLYQKLADNLKQSNQNITHINNINIVNMIMSKEKPYKFRNITINNNPYHGSQTKANKIKKKYNKKRNNTSLLIDYNKKVNNSTLSQEDIPKYKTNRFLFHSPDNNSRRKKKKNGLLKTKASNLSCKQLLNVKLNLNNKLYLKEKTNKLPKNILLHHKPNFTDIKRKTNENINNEETEENNLNNNNIYTNTSHNNIENKNNKGENRSCSEEILDIKELLDDFNLNKETESKYVDSEMNFKNKQENEDYEKDLEYQKTTIPFTIRVNLAKKINEMKLKNSSINYQNINNESNKINYNINLIIQKVIRFDIKKSNIKIYGNKKRMFFDNDDEIISFVKNKFKEKSTKYLSELQSKNYVTNIFGNINNNNKHQKNKYSYTGFVLTKKIKGKNILEFELNNINSLESINKIFKSEKFEINNEQVIFTTVNYLLQLREENKNIKIDNNKIKDDNKTINLNSTKIKDENNFIKLKYVKLKNDYDNILKDLKLANSKNKEYADDIIKKDIIIKKYEKKINQNQNEIKNIEKKISSYKNTNNNNTFLINQEIEININKISKKKISSDANKDINNQNNVKINENQNNFENNWIYGKNIIIGKGVKIDYIINSKKNDKKNNNNNLLIIKKENDFYFNKIEIDNKIQGKNNLIKIEKICYLNFDGINIDKNKINYNKFHQINNNNNEGIKKEEKKFFCNLTIEQINFINFGIIKIQKNKGNNLKKELIVNLNYYGEEKKSKNKNNNNLNKDNVQYLYYEGIKKENKINYNLNYINTINLYFEGKKSNNNDDKIKDTKLQGIQNKDLINYDLKIEHINNIYFDKIIKNLNLIIENNNLISFESIKKEKQNRLFEIIKIENISLANKNTIKKFNNNSIEIINILTIEKKEKINKENNYIIQQNNNFSLINIEKDINTKKFEYLEISKDIKNILFFEGIVKKRAENQIQKLYSSSLYDTISFETPKKVASTKNIKSNININIGNMNNISTISKKTENKEDNNSNTKSNNKKAERASRAINRIRKRNKSQVDIPNTIGSNIMQALQNIEKKKSNKEINYRQSFKIMEIAKQLEREITKQDFEDKKDNEIKKENNDNNNNLNYRDSISIDIISNKPIDNKKKKKQRISFIE